MKKLLIVDDDRFVLAELVRLCQRDGYECLQAMSGAGARAALGAGGFDLLLLDVGLPDIDGFALCRQIRIEHRFPILLLTARNETLDKVVGLEVGADDYITKPFEPPELLARIRAHLRRSEEYSCPLEVDHRINLGGLLIDPRARTVMRDGSEVPLTDREYELLHFMARHPNRALSMEWIFTSVWGSSADYGLKTLTVHVQRLRRKIEPDPAVPTYLVTMRGFGYKLCTQQMD